MKLHKYTVRSALFSGLLALYCLPAIAEQCFKPQSWFDPQKKQYLGTSEVNKQLNSKKIVLLGEHHANEAHHQWHKQVIEQLTAHDKKWQIGMEVFPRSRQRILDQWINREIDENTFKKKLNWDKAWSFPYEFYRPIFLLARQKSIPIIALNVERSLIQKTGKIGWNNIPHNEREGVSDPARPSKEYIRRLAISFQRHNTKPIGDKQKQQFLRFIQQQQLWDRAMAEGISSAIANAPERRMISIIGSWHLIGREGVAYQLTKLEKPDFYVAIPWDDHLLCDEVTEHFANIVYIP